MPGSWRQRALLPRCWAVLDKKPPKCYFLKVKCKDREKVARAVRPRECGTAESRARTPRERTPGSSKLNMASAIGRCAAGPALQGQRFFERVSDRTLPVIQVAPRTLQDSLFALNFQGRTKLSFFF